MRNVVAVMALLLSVGGIFVSLAREEMRCYLGLANECGIQEKTISPKPSQEAARESEKEAVSSERKIERTSEQKSSEPNPEQISKPEAVSETKESAEKPIETDTAQKSLSKPFKSQPIEVIPPPEASEQSGSIPLEVIPPPEAPQ